MPANGNTSNAKCICGCQGKPLPQCPPGSVDYGKYGTCPARKERKDRSRLQTQTNKKVSAAKKAQGKEQVRRNKEQLAEAVKLNGENHRIRLGLPALSRDEAIRRGLTTFLGNPCHRGHNEGRLTRNGECVVCKKAAGKTTPTSLPRKQQIQLPPSIQTFSKQHRIPLEKFFNAAGMKRAEYSQKMQAKDAIIAYNVTPCQKAGHTIRNRYGKCVVCDPKQVTFNNRAYQPGFVYAAESPSTELIKVGFAKNVEKRHKILNSQKYAGVSDWELFYSNQSTDAGRKEIDLHNLLHRFAANGLFYIKDGQKQLAREVYRCTRDDFFGALNKIKHD